MLYSAEIIRAVADSLSDWKGPLVIDPVMISTSGHSLLLEDARTVLMETLLPKAAWITPNIPEAEYLSGIKIRSARLLSVHYLIRLLYQGWDKSERDGYHH